MRRRMRPMSVLMAAVTLLVAACADDDGAEVRVVGDDGSVSISATGTGSASATGTATGLSLEEFEESGTDNPLVQQAVDGYKAYVVAEIDAMIASNEVFADARPRARRT